MLLKKRGRKPFALLFPLMRKIRPVRCALTGQTTKGQTPYPGPEMNQHKDFNNPKKYPMEIDHRDGNPANDHPSNLRWLTKAAHIFRTKIQLFPYRRKVRKGAPTRVVGNKGSWE